MVKYARAFVPDNPQHPSLMFASKALDYQSGATLRCVTTCKIHDFACKIRLRDVNSYWGGQCFYLVCHVSVIA